MRFIWLFLVIPFLTNGQHAIIRGVAPLAIGQEIQLRVYEDPISGKEQVLAKQLVDVDGSFELRVVPNGTQYAILQIGQNCADFFIEIDQDIELSFVPPKQDPKKPRAFYERHFFIPKITGGTTAKMNHEIIAFNDSINRFLERIYPIMVQRRSPKVVAKELANFDEKVLRDFAKAEPFVKDYIAYSLAGIEQTFLTDRDRLFAKYLKGKKVQPTNPAFIDFVLQFFQGVVSRKLLVDRLADTKKIVQRPEAFSKLDQIMADDPMLTATNLRRLALIAGMDEMFGHKDFEDKNLSKALRTFGTLSSNSYLGNAAINIAAKHEKLSVGTQAPEITFVNLKGAETRLTDVKGSYVYLELTDASNSYCQRETNVIRGLKNEFKNIRFVTIGVGNTESQLLALQKKMDIDWDFGGVAISSSLMDEYNIKSLPLFYIIDPDGKFYKVPASDPTKGAQNELMALQEQLKKQGRRRVGK
jgi:peroxiredoxin